MLLMCGADTGCVTHVPWPYGGLFRALQSLERGAPTTTGFVRSKSISQDCMKNEYRTRDEVRMLQPEQLQLSELKCLKPPKPCKWHYKAFWNLSNSHFCTRDRYPAEKRGPSTRGDAAFLEPDNEPRGQV